MTRKLTPALIERAATLAARGLPIPSVAEGCGVSPAGFRAWMKAAREGTGDELEIALLDRIQAAQVEAEQVLVDRVLSHAATDWRAASWMLSHHPRHREHYSDASAVRRAEWAILQRVADGIQSSRLSDEAKREVILSLRCQGLPTVEPAEGEQ